MDFWTVLTNVYFFFDFLLHFVGRRVPTKVTIYFYIYSLQLTKWLSVSMMDRV